jgi:hypothetical protein
MSIALVMAPWTIRNAVVLGKFIPLTTHAGTVWIDSVGGVQLSPEEIPVYNNALDQGKDGYMAVAFQRLWAKWEQSPPAFIVWKLNDTWDMIRKPWSSQQDPFNPLPPDVPKVTGPDYRLMGETAYAVWMALIGGIHVIALVLALAGLYLMRKRLVVWLVASGAIYTIVVCGIIGPRPRYFYPAMPAVLLLAGICVGYVVARAARWMGRKTTVTGQSGPRVNSGDSAEVAR